MRRSFLLIIFLLIVGGFYLLKDKTANPNQNWRPEEMAAINPENATFTFDDGSVTLSGGLGIKKDNEGGFSETVELLEERATGDLNADGKDDAIVLLARSGGGSGVFIYAAAYISGPVNYKGTNAIFLGDRISPQSIKIASGIATVNFLDRNPDEAFAAEPTVPRSQEFVYKDGAFRER